eukprot:TRINITY_DN16819_c0_g1_i1.p1 TRINITY_DN16819_c0_g1~~TRINITY_DN16819_c0_g1_i1.p1  ORF type:complete len:124 (-),score=42.74 TRINITY_DN16819_c0_g1_i1:17-349(-)
MSADSEKQITAVAYASIILADDQLPITAEKLTAITAAAGIIVQPFFVNLFVRAFTGRNLDDLLLSSGAGAAPAAAAAPAGPAPAAKEEKKVTKEEKKEESDGDMGFGLFD